MTTQELRQTAYSALVSRGVRYPMPDQVVAEMHRQNKAFAASGNSVEQLFGSLHGVAKAMGMHV